MELEVKEAARRLGVSESRVRQLVRAEALRGRRVGNSWLVCAEDVALRERARLRAGRPLAAPRAWAALDLLDAGQARWLPSSARSQVRSLLARLDDPGPEVWLSLLRARSDVVRVVAHPAALERLPGVDGVLRAGAGEAVSRGFDLVSLDASPEEVYVAAPVWPQVVSSLALRQSARPDLANLVVRIPRAVWPFEERGEVSEAALAADLVESAEPRAIAAGAARLSELVARWHRGRP